MLRSPVEICYILDLRGS